MGVKKVDKLSLAGTSRAKKKEPASRALRGPISKIPDDEFIERLGKSMLRQAPKTKVEKVVAEVERLKKAVLTLNIVGDTPIILNRMTQKVVHGLLLPERSGKMTRAEKDARLKHDMLHEFRDSPHRMRLPGSPTLLCMPSTAYKSAVRCAAVDLPNANKAQLGRTLWVLGEYQPIWGIPQMFTNVVRMKDPGRTPDVRTRCIVPRWASTFTMSFVVPTVNEKALINITEAAGLIQGLGDFRPEKGAGNYGQFHLVNADDPEFLAIKAEGGRTVQEQAMENPAFYDIDTEELYAWFVAAVDRRGKEAQLKSAEDGAGDDEEGSDED